MSSRPWSNVRLGRRAAPLAALLLIGAGPAASNSVDALQDIDAQRQARAVSRDADRARAQDVAASIARLRAQLIALGGQESSGQRQAGGARSALVRLNLQEAELKARMGHNQESLTRLLGALQMFARNPPPALLVDPRSARDAVRAAILIKAITPELEARAQTFTLASDQLKRVRRDEDAQSGVLFQAESRVAEREAEIADLITQKQALERQLYADADAAEGEAERLAARAHTLGELVTAVDAHDGSAGGEGAGAEGPEQALHLTPPVQGPVVHGFGQAGGDPERAKGLTWSTASGAAVLSPVAAEVDYAGPLKGWGNVLILHSGDYRLVLAGLGDVGTEAGRTVESGEPVGKMPGDTQKPTLYLEVRRASRPVDPGRWLSSPAVAAG